MAAKKSKPNNEHILDTETGEHVKESSGDSGACLTRHVAPCTEGDSCSHRWQAYRHATESDATKNMYNYPAYKKVCDDQAAKGNKTAVQKEQWDLGKSSTIYRHDKKVGATVQKTVPNFLSRADVPYPHNGHHMIPNSVLNGCLLSAAKNDMSLHYLARVGLLQAKYNLNDKLNMIILPMRRYVSVAIGLPRHISGIDRLPGDSPEKRNHTGYNRRVRVQVEPIIEKYASQIDTKQHNVTLPAMTKEDLERISKTIFASLQGWNAMGRALNAMPASLFVPKASS